MLLRLYTYDARSVREGWKTLLQSDTSLLHLRQEKTYSRLS